MDVSPRAAGWSSSSHGVVCPKQETTLRQSIECHFVCATNIDDRLGGAAAFQPADPSEVQFGGDPNHYPRSRQFLVRRPLQGFGVLQKRLSNTI